MATLQSVGRLLPLAIAIGMFASACTAPMGGSGGPSTGASVPVIGSSEPSPPTAAPTSGASSPVTVDLGAVGITPRGSRVTVHTFGPSERSLEPPAGSAWFEADLEWCLPSTLVNPVTLGNLRYEVKLEMSDGTTLEPEATADSPDEVYASDGTFKAGECVRGPLVFAVPAGAVPAYLQLDGHGGMRWRLA